MSGGKPGTAPSAAEQRAVAAAAADLQAAARQGSGDRRFEDEAAHFVRLLAEAQKAAKRNAGEE
ncbi:MAG: hypothetical protein IT557_08475 [Alphaproteobacteria bacterium]|nr:hypothetical protein [Alphaproteobacteria bacterium]